MDSIRPTPILRPSSLKTTWLTDFIRVPVGAPGPHAVASKPNCISNNLNKKPRDSTESTGLLDAKNATHTNLTRESKGPWV